MRKIVVALIGLSFIVSGKELKAQDNFYDIDSIREIKIYFNEPNWDDILDSLYIAGNEERLTAFSVVIDGNTYGNVGIRYKGFSSFSVNRKKNPLNLKLDYILPAQNHKGYDKIKLSNVIQDPSFIRETLSYEVARKYMPASRANYANVYINDTLYGLYTNVESVDAEFLQKNYGSTTENTFVKCNPENLDLFGENSNLSNTLGSDSTLYYPLYDMKSDFGWAQLYNLIDTLNNYPNSIENILNVDRTLWMHAFNYAVINFDSYVGYAQNYYLYKDVNGRFNPIIWDLNMSFASFRLADASIHFSGFNISEAQTMDPLLHYNNVSVYPRPLMRNLFNNATYRRMYLAHLRTIMEENFDNQDYLARGTAMQTLIDSSVFNDTNKFYTYADFGNNLTMTVSDLVDYPGITELMDARSTYLSTYPGFQGAPTINSLNALPGSITQGDSAWITAKVVDADSVILGYRYNGTDVFTKIQMLDDGGHNDGVAGDSIYGALIHDVGYTVQYYIYAENDSSGRFSPERAAYEYHTITVGQDVVLNELCAVNHGIWLDDQGDSDDWIELYNNASNAVDLTGYYLSDEYWNLTKWQFPAVTIPANGFLIVWADEDGLDPGLHANFKLAEIGEKIFLSDSSGNLIDEVTFGYQSAGVITYARIPNGTGPWQYTKSSHNQTNYAYPIGIEENEIIVHENDFVLYPNPASQQINIKVNESDDFQIIIRDINGRTLLSENMNTDSFTHSIDINNFTSGFYMVTLTNKDFTSTKKFIIK